MKRATELMWPAAALLVGWLIVPDVVQAHEGEGFHPEAFWALLQTGLLVVVGIFGLVGILWAYERVKSRKAK